MPPYVIVMAGQDEAGGTPSPNNDQTQTAPPVSGWGRPSSSLGSFLSFYQAETREGSSTIEKRTPAL